MTTSAWALILNGAVAEVTTINPTGRFHPALQWVPCDGTVQQGWTYVAGVFAAPVVAAPVLTPAQQAQAALAAGLTISSPTIPLAGVAFPTDLGAQAKYNSVQTNINTHATFPGGAVSGPIKDSTGAWHTVTTAQYTAIVTAISAFVSACDLVVDGYPGATVPASSVTIA